LVPSLVAAALAASAWYSALRLLRNAIEGVPDMSGSNMLLGTLVGLAGIVAGSLTAALSISRVSVVDALRS